METTFASQFMPNNTTRVARQMFLAGGGTNGHARYAHISIELAQGTIDTSTIDANHYALTLCGQTWESGEAYADLGNSTIKICQACSKKYLK